MADNRGEYKVIPIDKIQVNSWNPNELTDDMFNQLAEDIGDEDVGNLQPILVTKLEDGTYRIIDGEHRYDAARYNGDEEVPCIIAKGKLATDEDRQKFQTVRMNKIRGKMNQRKFVEMVKDLAKRHTIDELAKNLVFEDPSELEAMIDAARKTLPTAEMKKEFDKAKAEIKTVDDLSLVLNKLFTEYGDSLKFNFMVLDFGGKKHLWVRIPDQKKYAFVLDKARLCADHNVTFNSLLMALLGMVNEEFIAASMDMLESAEVDE